MMTHCLLYLFVVQLVCIATSTVYYVRPNYDEHPPPVVDTYTLHSLLTKFKHFSSSTEIHFLPGIHCLRKNLTIVGIDNIVLAGDSSIIKCNGSVGLVAINVTNLTIGNISFINCRRDCSQYSSLINPNQINPSLDDNTLGWNAAVLLYNCELITVTNVSLQVEADVHALVGIDLINTSNFYNIQVQMIIGFLKSSYDLRQWSSVAIHCQHSSIKANGMIIIDNFQFTVTRLNSMHNTFIPIALEVVILKHLAEVMIIVQNTNFTGLHNTIALWYQAESCIHDDAKNSLIINNTKVHNNHADFPMAMFNINIYGCGFIFNSSGCYSDKHSLLLVNSSFKANNNISNIVSIFLKQTLISSVNITIYNCAVCDNSDTQFIITKSEIENLWQITHRIILSFVNITNNKHRNGLHLLSFVHGKVTFQNEMLISENSYYDGIVKLFFSEIRFHGNIDLSNNIAYRLIDTCDNSYFIVKEKVTLRIVNNTFHNVINFADWGDNILHANSEDTCLLQFSSSRGNLDDELEANSADLHFNILVSNNTYVLPTYLIKLDSDLGLDHNCSWLAKTSFKTTQPYRTAEKFIKVSNYTVMQSFDTNVIPSKICQCYPNGSIDCNLRQLGPIFPGQTLKVNLTVPTLTSSNVFVLMAARILGTSDKACLIDNFNEIYQMKHNHNCQEYYYTIKYYTFKSCELYLRMQYHDAEMFFIQLNPCPPGFALQNNACTCDPLLQLKGMEVKKCDINTCTITRPANSWIYAINSSGSDYGYRISLHCPQDYSLPHSSQLNLNDPNSQCQFNRVGLLCGHCKPGLSTVFGSSRCKQCSNTSLFIIVPGLIIGVILIVMLFIFNITVVNGTVNTFSFYIDIINTNTLMYYYSHKTFFNFPYGIEICFYNGMTSYAKTWFGLMYPLFIILVAVVFIIASRYFSIVQRITAHRALPVLATLFLLSYTGLLRTVGFVIYAFSTVTDIPSHRNTMIWSLDTNVSLHSMKFIITFVVCLLLSLLLIIFHVVLLLNRKLYRFKIINTFKPLLDIYLSPYQDRVFYWVGVQLLVRRTMFVLTMFDKHISLLVGSVVIGLMLCIQGIVQPFKSKFMNIQESLVLFNLLTINIIALYNDGPTEQLSIKILINTTLVCLFVLIAAHCLMSTCGKTIEKHKNSLKMCLEAWQTRLIHKGKTGTTKMMAMGNLRNEIADVTYNYREFQEPLVELGD